MAVTVTRAISVVTSRHLSPSFVLKRLLSCSSSSFICRPPPIPNLLAGRRHPAPISHALRLVVPAANCLTSVRCQVNRSDNAYSPLSTSGTGTTNFSDRPPTEMAPLFPGCDYEHWLIVMDKPGGDGATKLQMIDCYVQTLAKILGRWPHLYFFCLLIFIFEIFGV